MSHSQAPGHGQTESQWQGYRQSVVRGMKATEGYAASI